MRTDEKGVGILCFEIKTTTSPHLFRVHGLVTRYKILLLVIQVFQSETLKVIAVRSFVLQRRRATTMRSSPGSTCTTLPA